jgi:hypothetical protein
VFGFSHDADSDAVIDDSAVNVQTPPGTRWYESGTTAQATVFAGETASLQPVGQITVNNLPDPVVVSCIARDSAGQCYFTLHESRGWWFRIAYPQYPEGLLGTRTAYVRVGPIQVLPIDSTAWHPCSYAPSDQCREIRSRQFQTDALIYTMNIAQTSMPSLVDTIPDQTVFWLGQGESGADVVFAHGTYNDTHWTSPERFFAGLSPFYDFNYTLETCQIEYREKLNFQTNIGMPIADMDGCPLGEADGPSIWSGSGTIAPLVRQRLRRNVDTRAADDPISIPLPIRKIGA